MTADESFVTHAHRAARKDDERNLIFPSQRKVLAIARRTSAVSLSAILYVFKGTLIHKIQ